MATDKPGGGRKGRGGPLNSKAAMDEFFAGRGDHSPSAGIRPTGRAARGQGQEYEDRRWIANKIDVLAANAGVLQANISTYRGTKVDQYKISAKKERLSYIRQVMSTAQGVARSGGDWADKRLIIEDIAAGVVGVGR